MRSPASAAAAPASRAATPPPKFIRPKFERMPVELKQLKNWVLLVPIRKDRSGQNAQSNRRDSAQAGRSAAAPTSASVRRSDVMHSRATDRRSASKCQGKWPDQTLDQAFGLPEVLVAVSTSRLSCKRAGKTRTLMPVGIHLETLIKAFSSKNAEILRHAAMFKNVRRTRPYATTSRMLFNFIPSG